jgi:solute carrier family 25 uncoupling protein 8/9
VDVLKTRIMNAPTGTYSSPLDAFTKTLSNEGAGAFYKGFVPNAARIAGWNVVMFLTLEQIKKQFV